MDCLGQSLMVPMAIICAEVCRPLWSVYPITEPTGSGTLNKPSVPRDVGPDKGGWMAVKRLAKEILAGWQHLNPKHSLEDHQRKPISEPDNELPPIERGF